MQSLLQYVANNSNQQIKPSQLSRLIVTNQNHPSELFNSDSSSEIEQQFTSVESKQIPILYVHLTIIEDTYIIPIYTDFDINYLNQYIKGKEQYIDIIYNKVCDRIEEYINQLNIINYKQEQNQNKKRVYINDKQEKNGQIIYKLEIDNKTYNLTFVKFPIESYINIRKLECFGRKLDIKLNQCEEFNKTVQKFIQNNSLSLEIHKELIDVLKNDL